MKRVDLRGAANADIVRLLRKPAFDEVVISGKVQARIEKTFGEPLSPQQLVDRIVGDIRRRGDEAVLEYTAKIDGVKLTAAGMEVTAAEKKQAMAAAPAELAAGLQQAAANIRRFHEEQLANDRPWTSSRGTGSWVGQRRTPLDRVGIYVPGGTAAYPSSVLMTAIPAVVAGVREVIMMVPPSPDGSVNPSVLAAAEIAGVQRIFRIGGAQAIAALAFGTATVPRVDKIVGPGNIFVTLTKKAVYGHCDIDMLAGPSEIMIVADGSADVAYVAADMLSQAEHDELASSILVTDSETLAAQVEQELQEQLATLPRAATAQTALDRQGMVLLVRDLAQAAECVNAAAPEHLEILTEMPESLLPGIRHAGAIFLGTGSPEPLGDYFAGPSHVLPTGGTARYASVLNVDTFRKTTSLIAYAPADLAVVGADIVRLAEAEGLSAHARAIALRRYNNV
ncbi:MAG: histidinol dehydrogenase [Veillonellaceae bacterium]|nr:histidinol dehydrogenase [Veillonellaceae bacterium]